MITFDASNPKLHAEAGWCVKPRREGNDDGMSRTKRGGASLYSYIKGVYLRFVLTDRNLVNSILGQKQSYGQRPSGMYCIPVFVLS